MDHAGFRQGGYMNNMQFAVPTLFGLEGLAGDELRRMDLSDVQVENGRVLFSGDLCHKGPQEDFPISVFDEPLDLAVCEVAHFPATKYLPLFENQPNLKQLCFNHYSHTFQSYIYDVMKALDIPVFMASDGTEIVL